ncbi:MAG: AAA family ATPase [Lachnospiraceae bacterium]
MKRPRVIVADTDAAYTVPLQLKFVEEYFQQIELEIITQQAYFEALFSVPQSVDVLIVSEDLYSEGLQRHSINHIFLMQERLEEAETTAALNVNRIAKYASIKEIFNKITGIWGGPVGADANKKESQIILVTSAAGGVGKTTVAMGLSAALAKNYKRVLYINAERLQNFQARLTNPAPITLNEIYAKLLTGSKDLYGDIRYAIREEGFQYLPPFKAALTSLGLPYRIFEQLALSAKQSKNYDFVIVDADNTFDEEKTRLIDMADKVIIVTTQSKTAVFATNRLYESISGASGEKFLYVCNHFDRDADNSLTDPALKPRFSINEYIQRFQEPDKRNLEALSKEKDMQELAYLLI